MTITATSIHELVIAGVDFDQILRSMNDSNAVVLTGKLVQNHFDHVAQWCVGSVVPTDSIPRGSHHGLLQDWIVVDRVFRPDVDLVAFYRERFDPLPGQRLVVLVIGDGEESGKWHCGIFHRGNYEAVDRVRVIGISNLILERSNDNETDVDIEGIRWSRLRHMFGDIAFRRIRNTHVMIFGASRNGSIAARQLAAIGVGKLTLVDPDVLETHNFDAMLGGNMADIGRSKVSALADELIRFRDDLAVTGLPWTATDRRVIARARSADVYITCVDHGTPVMLAAKMANRWNKVHIDLGTNVQHGTSGGLEIHGDVRLFQPHDACALCVGGVGNRQEAEIDMLLPPGTVAIRPKQDFRQHRAGSLVTINGITVSIAVQMLCDHLTTNGSGSSRWARVTYTTLDGFSISSLKVSNVIECENCSKTI